jgi:hypothetical protein
VYGPRKTAERTALFGLVAASAIGTAAGARFHPHYYIQLILPLALLAAPHYAAFWYRKTRPHYCLLRPTVTYIWLALTVIAFSITHWRELAQPKTSDTGRYLAMHSAPADRIFVWGQAPRIYLDARRRPACRYILTFPLTGYMFGKLVGVDTRDRIMPGAWNTLEQDFGKHPRLHRRCPAPCLQRAVSSTEFSYSSQTIGEPVSTGGVDHRGCGL